MLLCIFLLLGTLIALLKSNKVQNLVVQLVVHNLSEDLHTNIQVKSVDYQLFNKILINNIYVEDLQQDTLLYIDNIEAHFNFWGFFRKEIQFSRADVNALSMHLSVNEAGMSNFAFLFSPSSQKQKSTFAGMVQVKEVRLNKAAFTFEREGGKPHYADVFSADDVHVVDLDAVLELQHFSADSLNAQIKSLNFKETSGFELTDLQTHFVANNKMACVPKLLLQLPHSEISTDVVSIKYDSLLEAIQDISHKVNWNVALQTAHVALGDLKAFIPAFKQTTGFADVSAQLSGTIANLKLSDLDVRYNNDPLLSGNVELNGLPVLADTYVYAELKDLNFTKAKLQDFIADLQGKPFLLPENLNTLGKVHYSGILTGFLSDLVAYGTLKTQIGSIATDMLLKTDDNFQNLSFGGSVKTRNFQLGKLLANNDVGNITLNVQITGEKGLTEPLNGDVKANIESIGYKNYLYQDIDIDGAYNMGGFDGHLAFSDENLTCRFDGLFDLTQDKPLLNVEIQVDTLKIHELHLTDKYQESNLAGHITMNLAGNNLDDVNGYIVVNDLSFKTQTDRLVIDNISVYANTTDTQNHFSIQSDYLNAIISGEYKYSTLAATVQKILVQYIPAFFSPEKQKQIILQSSNNSLEFDVYLKRTDKITHILEFPVHLPEISMIKGFINESENKFNLRMGVPVFQFKKMKLEDFTLNCDNMSDRINLSAYIQHGHSKNVLTCLAKLEAQHDTIRTQIKWSNNDTIQNTGTVKTDFALRQQSDGRWMNMYIHSSDIVMSDSLWHLGEGNVVFCPDQTIRIDNFNFGSANQFVRVDGVAGKTENDSILIHMKDLQLGYFMSFSPVSKSILFDGRVTGDGYLYSLLQQPVFDAKAHVKDASMNGIPVGDADATAQWDREAKSVVINGTCIENEQDTIATVVGLVIPKQDSLDLKFDATGIDMGFLNYWMSTVVQDVAGKGYGKVHVFGKPKQKVTFVEAQAFVKEGALSVDMLGTRYFFSDSINMTTHSIEMKNIHVTDKEGNKALLNGYLNHNGLFQNLNYNLAIDCDNIIGMDTQMADNDFFFGKLYASGKVSIRGDEKETNIYVNAVTKPHSKFNISLASTTVAADNSFITFVDKTPKIKEEEKGTNDKVNSSVVKLVLLVDVTPDVSLQLIIDPKAGDMITAKGDGNMRFEYDTQNNIKLQGTYTIQSGSYLFTLQEMFRREFKIDNGSNITWTGDPFNADVNIRGLYSLTASLKDLMGTEINKLATSRTSVPVNCVLNLSEDLMSPDIKFDIYLPNSDEGVRQQVKNIINTDEMMNRQIIYLLLFGKFYTPEYLQSSTANVGTNEAYSLLTSTVTNQINNWISKLTQDFTFGFNMRSDGEGEDSSQEYETEFLYQPNNRFVVNGKFGYRNDDVATNKFIGDVDVEYLLNATGKLRAKAYTHTVDKYSLKTAQTQQGVGVVYKEDFNTVGELLNDYANTIRKAFRKKNKNNDVKQEDKK